MVCVDDIIDFAQANMPTLADLPKEELAAYIEEHLRYGTISVVIKDYKVVGLLRINVDSSVAEVLDLIILDGENMKLLTRYMALELWQRFPYLKYFSFERFMKYPLRKQRIYSINRLLKTGEVYGR